MAAHLGGLVIRGADLAGGDLGLDEVVALEVAGGDAVAVEAGDGEV